MMIVAPSLAQLVVRFDRIEHNVSTLRSDVTVVQRSLGLSGFWVSTTSNDKFNVMDV
jgi:uncharacterized protein (UPF0335 family)